MTAASAVIDMEGIDEDMTSVQLNAAPSDVSKEQHDNSSSQGELFGSTRDAMTKMVWEAGRSQAAKAWSIYGNIDLLRPYFDVEPQDVMKRSLQSMIPKRPSATPIKVVTELYGPSMLVLTLIALILNEMKSSGHTVREGTLIGTAFGTCFGYWLGCGSLIWIISYVCNTHISYLQLLSMLGYSLTGHNLIVLLSSIVHTSHDHMLFYFLWGTFGGLTTLRMMSILVSRTHGPTQKLIVCGTIVLFNLSSMLYLHFAYHQIVEGIDDMIGEESTHQSAKIVKQAVPTAQQQ